MTEITVELIDVMGNDLKVVNAARRSFGAEVTEIGKREVGLIRYLARGMPEEEWVNFAEKMAWGSSDRQKIKDRLNEYRDTSTHWTPFAHCYMTFHVQMPIFISRQLIRHTVGVTISEMSRRYVKSDPEYWFPKEGEWRLAADNVKQGSSKEFLTGVQAVEWHKAVQDYCQQGLELYRKGVDKYKVAPELARIILNLNSMTDWHWTISLVTAARVCKQRFNAHAQKEIQDLAQKINEQTYKAFPICWTALMTNGTEEIEP